MSALYDFSIVPFKATLENLLHVMGKAEEYAKEKGENVDDYVQLQIHPDMKGFAYQIQRISDTAKFVVIRVAGADSAPLAMEDNEKTWADCKSRLQRTIDVLAGADPKSFEGQEGREISMFDGKFKFTGKSYLQTFAIPNFYFHCVTAYDLLRMHGVPIGKLDYLQGGRPNQA